MTTIEETLTKLHELKLTSMAQAVRELMDTAPGHQLLVRHLPTQPAAPDTVRTSFDSHGDSTPTRLTPVTRRFAPITLKCFGTSAQVPAERALKWTGMRTLDATLRRSGCLHALAGSKKRCAMIRTDAAKSRRAHSADRRRVAQPQPNSVSSLPTISRRHCARSFCASTPSSSACAVLTPIFSLGRLTPFTVFEPSSEAGAEHRRRSC